MSLKTLPTAHAASEHAATNLLLTGFVAKGQFTAPSSRACLHRGTLGPTAVIGVSLSYLGRAGQMLAGGEDTTSADPIDRGHVCEGKFFHNSERPQSATITRNIALAPTERPFVRARGQQHSTPAAGEEGGRRGKESIMTCGRARGRRLYISATEESVEERGRKKRG
jgi:hypothetical protein